jgi:ribosomal-protein-alanine N-acetyltransferase
MILSKLPEQFPSLETERLILRQLTSADREVIFQNYSTLESTQFIMEPLTTLEQADEILQDFIEGFKLGRNLFWAVELKKNHAFTGTVCFESFEWGDLRGEIGYDLSKGFWGQGLMTEALQVVIDYGFECLGLNRIDGYVDVENASSIKVLRRLHFTEEGVLRQYSCVKGQYRDEVVCSLLKQEWKRN